MTITGTNHFPDAQSAVSYYWSQLGDETKAGFEEAKRQVKIKILENSIKFGLPPVKPGQKVQLNLREGRYFIIEK